MLKIWEAPKDVLVIRWCFFRIHCFPFWQQSLYVVPIGIWLIKFGLIFEVLQLQEIKTYNTQ